MKHPFPPNKQTGNSMSIAKSGNNMMSNMTNKFFDKFFRRADGVVWDMMTGAIGIQTDEGIATLSGTGDDAQITINMFDDFGISLPAFAQSTPVANIAVGDIIYRGARNNIAWVIEKNDDNTKFKLMKPTGDIVSYNPPKVSMLGFDSGVMVLRSLVNMLPNGTDGVNQMQNMMMPLMISGMMDDSSMDSMMPFMLMQMMNGNNTNGGMNGMMMLPFMAMMKSGKFGL